MNNNDFLEFQSFDESYGVRLSQENLDLIKNLCAESLPNETGGILIGTYSKDHRWAEITKVTTPPAGSKHTRMSFTRATSSLISLLDKLWEKNQYYIGEWHYHPLSSPTPSLTDLQTMHKLSRTKNLYCPEPILFIVGGGPTNWTFSLSVFVSNQQVILRQI